MIIATETPAITIGMPVFNDVFFVEAAIKSLLAQTFSNFQLIISDDCSTDGSAVVCQKMAAQDARITYIRQAQNSGISKNMEFLLKEAKSAYFMWAADDDLWSPNFIEKLIDALERDKSAICAFGTFATINEEGDFIKSGIDYNYNAKNALTRLTKYIKNPNDSFGYAIFRREQINTIKFAVWWWPNKKCAYNNIYPTLCFYLSKGQYLHLKGESLFLNRLKNNNSINHYLPYPENTIKETIAYFIRKFNLILVSLNRITTGSNLIVALSVFPILSYEWFVKPCCLKMKHYLKISFIS